MSGGYDTVLYDHPIYPIIIIVGSDSSTPCGGTCLAYL